MNFPQALIMQNVLHQIAKDLTTRMRKYNRSLVLIYINYSFRLCKHHLSKAVLCILKKEMRNTYRGPDKAYASMDFSGKGHIT